MLTDFLQKVKTLLKENRQDLFLAAVVFLVGVGSFGLGRLSAIWPTKEPVRIDKPVGNDEIDGIDRLYNSIKRSDISTPTISSPRGNLVASRNGSSYHLPDCPGAKQIKDENKVWFQTADEARKAGYKPAGNCPGL